MAPKQPILVHTAQDRPQPRLDVHHGRGMTVHVGRIRPCPIFGYKLVAMGHNVVRGAAGAALLNAELIVARERSRADGHADRELEAVPATGQIHVQQA
jgi:aspartate-semialdehyde dehydrogenase